MAASMSPRFSQRADVVLTEMNDGTGVLLHMTTKFYYTLNKTGVFVWKEIEKGPLAASDLASRVHKRYAVEAERATKDVDTVLGELLREELIESKS